MFALGSVCWVCALLLSTSAPAPLQAARESVVPDGFHLDLVSGLVVNQPHRDSAWLSYSAGRLEFSRPARELERAGPGWSSTVERGRSLEAVKALARDGQEWVFEHEDGWGYLAVRRASPEVLVLERVLATPGLNELLRRPETTLATSVAEGLRLTWSDPGGGPWRVLRAEVPSDGPVQALVFGSLTETSEAEYLDTDVESEVLYEYRVARAGENPFGASVRAVHDAWTAGTVVRVARGTPVSLLSGRTDGRRVDLKVDYVNADGLQLSPAEGRALRLLSPTEAQSWTLPSMGESLSPQPRLFAQAGRSLLMRLPEGIYARLSIVDGDHDLPELACQVDWNGDSVFPLAPRAPEISWTDAGSMFELALEAEPESRPPGTRLVLEREDVFASEEFIEVLDRPVEAESLIDPLGGAPRIVRYRLRYRTPGGLESPACVPVGVLVGDDGSTEVTAELVAMAVGGLGDPEYPKRESARAMLQLLGSRAVSGLRDALASEDPEVAGNAREILNKLDSPGEDGERPAALVLRARAMAEGLQGDPPDPGLLEESSARRASALMRLIAKSGAAPEGELESWRLLVSEVDPDVGVRNLAAHWGNLGPEGELEDFHLDWNAPQGDSLDSVEASGELASWILDRIGAGGTIDSGDRSLYALYWEARALESDTLIESELRERVRLAELLVARHREQPDKSLLEAADRLATDSVSLLRAFRGYGELRGLPYGQPREIMRLETASGAALVAAVDGLGGDPSRAVELVLPSGVYDLSNENSRLRCTVSNLSLRAEGEVRLKGMLELSHVESVEIIGISIEGGAGPAMLVEASSVLVSGCSLRGGNTYINGSDSLVVLEDCEFLDPENRSGAVGVRLGGDGFLHAKNTLFDTGSSACQSTKNVLLERCVIHSGKRNGMDGVRGGTVMMIDCLVESHATAISNAERGLLDGLVLVDGRVANAQGTEVCLEHLSSVGESTKSEPGLEVCPLGRTR